MSGADARTQLFAAARSGDVAALAPLLGDLMAPAGTDGAGTVVVPAAARETGAPAQPAAQAAPATGCEPQHSPGGPMQGAGAGRGASCFGCLSACRWPHSDRRRGWRLARATDALGNTVMHVAAQYGKVAVMRALVQDAGLSMLLAQPNSFTKATPLHAAAMHNSEAAVLFCLEQIRAAQERLARDGAHDASRTDRALAALVDARDQYGRTALHWYDAPAAPSVAPPACGPAHAAACTRRAAGNGNLHMVRHLLLHDANPVARNNAQQTPLSISRTPAIRRMLRDGRWHAHVRACDPSRRQCQRRVRTLSCLLVPPGPPSHRHRSCAAAGTGHRGGAERTSAAGL